MLATYSPRGNDLALLIQELIGKACTFAFFTSERGILERASDVDVHIMLAVEGLHL